MQAEMSSKKRTRKRRSSKGRRNQGRTGLKRYGLIAGTIVLAVAVLAVIVVLDQGSGRSQADDGQVSLEKSDGAPDAPVVVVEYGDFQCPYCRQFANGAVRQLKEDYVAGGQVRFVFRHLAFIGNESTWAAEASECANEQGRFWEYHDKLFDEQREENRGAFSKDNLKRFAAELELDTEQFDQCLDSREYRSQVQDDVNEAQRRGIRSTPSVLVNGQLIRDGSNYQVLQAAVEAALQSQ
jgi:protein-disulfide isomerase